VRYSIVVRGGLADRTLERLEGLEARHWPGRTELVGDVVDQAHLVGLLSELSRAEIEVISATPVSGGAGSRPSRE
jgi:hypothetical protein